MKDNVVWGIWAEKAVVTNIVKKYPEIPRLYTQTGLLKVVGSYLLGILPFIDL